MSNNLQTSYKGYKTKQFINSVLGIFNALFTISISVIITLNLTFIYKLTIYKYNLSKVSGLTVEELMINYKKIIVYLQNPFIEKLYFPNFSMSIQGEIHFQDVKRIFIYIDIYIFLVMILMGVYFLIRDKIRYDNYIELKYILNSSANYILVFVTFLMLCILINFSEIFITFHKIFFRNNYWAFDSNLDPIIDVLPEEFFMIMSVIILIFILVYALISKIYYYKNCK
ncbi:TIGR01906 family membrane protein [Clostridium aquiflavi]|uniref:TIGR01906 family membrane protein n=1 Tax=Clostridium aquiflavi TaxID=3073603 RepID=A0ABU1EGL5_9CLOT|nr:TIGR01906 family membrane protein [Clostridium sp. 5N-1]MDR5587520.1 TIGR01906 family membrane protein [Clostridium sp. 5N-1]